MSVAIFAADFAKAEQIVGRGMQSTIDQIAQAIATEREQCAQIAEHLNGWGDAATRASGLAQHIAKVIRDQR